MADISVEFDPSAIGNAIDNAARSVFGDDFVNGVSDFVTTDIPGFFNKYVPETWKYINGEKDYALSSEYLGEQYRYNQQLQNSANAASSYLQELAQSFNAAEAEKAYKRQLDLQEKSQNWSSQENKLSREATEALVAQNLAWQERMSNTAIQRAIADARSAGINPYIAYSQGGAPVTSGSSASFGMVNSGSPTAAAASSSNAHGATASVHGSLGKVSKIADLLGDVVRSAATIAAFA